MSPPNEHLAGSQWWTRYQPVSYNIISRSGNETAFTSMVKRCSAVGVGIIVDSVINHMAGGSGISITGTSFSNRQFAMYSPQDFHHDTNNIYSNCQVTNNSDKNNVQSCDLVGLPDLLTSSEYVQSTIANYLNHLASLGVFGIRIDAAKHQDASEMAGITKRLPAGFYIGQEVVDVVGEVGEAVTSSMYYGIGQVSEFLYSDSLCSNVIADGRMMYLNNLGESFGLMPDQYAAIFIDK